VRALVGLAVAVALSIVLFELTMRPSAEERTQLLVLFTVMAVGTALLGRLLPRWLGRFRSLRSAVLVIALAAVGAVAAAPGIAARMMFLQPHDLQLLAVVLGFAVGLGAVLATTLASGLTEDLRRIGDTVARVADGDLASRTGVERDDELGAAAMAVDEMAAALESAEHERSRDTAARRHFLAAVGHDLRSPLAALRAAVEALEDGLAPDPARYLRSMRADVAAMSHLVDDLFMLSTIEAGRLTIDRQPVDLSELADESIDALRPMAVERGVELRLDTDGGVPTMAGAAELGRAIRNLLHNAIRFSPPSSVVVVRVSNGDRASLEVCDEGPGLSPETVGEVFDEFFTGDPARTRLDGGAGLGLAIARGIVDAHDGEIWAEPGPGGRVGFRLPVGR
jgi:two-component system sensor histidine kinase BaeS